MTTVATRIDAQTVCVAVVGDLDRSTAATLTGTVERLVRDTSLASIVLDLTDLRFIDVGGARALHEAGATCSTMNCRLDLTNPRPIVLRVLQIVGLTDLAAHPSGAMPPAGTRQPESKPESRLDARLTADRSAMLVTRRNAAALQATAREVLARTADIQRDNAVLLARIAARWGQRPTSGDTPGH